MKKRSKKRRVDEKKVKKDMDIRNKLEKYQGITGGTFYDNVT
jgi:hypothetical protein